MAAASSSSTSACAKNYTLFHSNAAPGLYEFSNLYGTEFEFNGLKYGSAEAAFQSLKVSQPERFAVGGDLADHAKVTKYLSEGQAKPVTFAGMKKKNMTGILAKKVIGRPLLFGLDIVKKPTGDSDPEYEAWSTAKALWFDIFEAKFKGKLLKLLLKTKGELVEFDRFAKDDTKWGAKLVDGQLIGRNVMGKLLTEFRDSKRPKRKRESEPSSPVKAFKVVSQQEILDEAYKAAKKSGDMIVIDEDEDNLLPSNWDSMSPKEKATYGFSHNFSHIDWMRYVQPAMDGAEVVPESPYSSPYSSPVIGPSPESPMRSPAKGPAEVPEVPEPLKLRAVSSDDSDSSDSSDDEEEEGVVDCSAAVITLSNAVESDPSAEAVGTAGPGLKRSELRRLAKQLNGQIYKVDASFNGETVKGRVLHCKNFLSKEEHDALYAEIRGVPEPFIDKKMINRLNGKLCNKSRWNSNLTNDTVAGNIADHISSQFPFEKMPEASKLRNKVSILGDLTHVEKIKDLFGEINYYGIKKENEKTAPKVAPGIAPHIDQERNLVLGLNLGASRILCVCPFAGPQPAGARLQLEINPGDLYAFDSKAAGGSSYRGLHIRHWASGGRGDAKYIADIDSAFHLKLKKKIEKMKEKGKVWEQTEETKYIMEHKAPRTMCVLE